MNKKVLIKRLLLCITGLMLSALGVAFTKYADLGVAPASSVANVLFCRYPHISLGMWLFVWNVLLLTAQVIMLKNHFKCVQLLQLPLSVLFGIFTDLGLWCISLIRLGSLVSRFLLLFAGIAVRSFGIALCISAGLILNSNEAFVNVLADKIRFKFGDVKVVYDICCVVLAMLLSLVLFDFSIVGIGWGTLISSIFTGAAVNTFTKILKKPLYKICHE